jgi:hypothetical protein
LLQRYALDHMHFPEHPFTRAAATGKKSRLSALARQGFLAHINWRGQGMTS